MKVKILVSVLTLIICVFAVRGIHTVNQMSASYSLTHVQNNSATSDIGLSFDWYGITMVDTAVKFANGIIDSAQATQVLTDGSKQNVELLKQYYKNVLPQEKDAAAFIYSQDILANKLTEELLLLISKNDRKGVNAMIPSIYEVVDPICKQINDIIEIKTKSSQAINIELNKEIREIKGFMLASFALCISLCGGLLLKD
jgi:hypothetical protein